MREVSKDLKDSWAICTLFSCLRRAWGLSWRVIYRCSLQLSIAHPREHRAGITTPFLNRGHPASNEHLKKQQRLIWAAPEGFRLLFYDIACFLAKIYLPWCASTIPRLHCISVTEFKAIYSKLREPRPGGRVFGWRRGAGNSYLQMGSSEKNKANGFPTWRNIYP